MRYKVDCTVPVVCSTCWSIASAALYQGPDCTVHVDLDLASSLIRNQSLFFLLLLLQLFLYKIVQRMQGGCGDWDGYHRPRSAAHAYPATGEVALSGIFMAAKIMDAKC